MKYLMIVLIPIFAFSFAQAESASCAAGETKTKVKVQMIRIDGTIQTADGKILSKDYGEVLEQGPDHVLETTYYCGEFSKPAIRMMMDAMAAKYELGARRGDIYLNKDNSFARQSYVEGLLTLNTSNIATINRLIKDEPTP